MILYDTIIVIISHTYCYYILQSLLSLSLVLKEIVKCDHKFVNSVFDFMNINFYLSSFNHFAKLPLSQKKKVFPILYF